MYSGCWFVLELMVNVLGIHLRQFKVVAPTAVIVLFHCNRFCLSILNLGRCWVLAMHILAPLSGKIKTNSGVNEFGVLDDGKESWAGILAIFVLLIADMDCGCKFCCGISAIRALADSVFLGCLQALAKWFLVLQLKQIFPQAGQAWECLNNWWYWLPQSEFCFFVIWDFSGH